MFNIGENISFFSLDEEFDRVQFRDIDLFIDNLFCLFTHLFTDSFIYF